MATPWYVHTERGLLEFPSTDYFAALVLGNHEMECTPHCNILRAGLAYHPGDYVHLRQSGHCGVPMAQTVTFHWPQ